MPKVAVMNSTDGSVTLKEGFNLLGFGKVTYKKIQNDGLVDMTKEPPALPPQHKLKYSHGGRSRRTAKPVLKEVPCRCSLDVLSLAYCSFVHHSMAKYILGEHGIGD